jgi:hypothetical protein
MKQALLIVLLAVCTNVLLAQNRNTAQPPAVRHDATVDVQYAPAALHQHPRLNVPTPRTAPRNMSVRKAPAAANQFQIGLMANQFSSVGSNRIQVACDPATNQVAAIHRGNDRAGSSVGNTIFVRYSADHGATWGAAGTNVANTTSPRYPQVFLYNPTQSTNAADVKSVVLWPQIITYSTTSTWGEVNALRSDVGGANKQYTKWPTPPNWSIPAEIMPANGASKLFSFTEALEPSNGSSTGSEYVLSSVDGGLTWAPVNTNLDPAWTDAVIASDERMNDLCYDVSNDGQNVVLAYISLKVGADGIPYIGEDHRIAYWESTDGGVTFPTTAQFISLRDIPNLPSPLEVVQQADRTIVPMLGWDLDVTYDANKNLHFLVSASTDQAWWSPINSFTRINDSTISIDWQDYVDSTFMCEVVKSPTDTRLNIVGRTRSPFAIRGSYQIEYTDGSMAWSKVYHEPQWAVSADGFKVYAKWVDVDSSLKWPYVTVENNQITGYLRDSITNIWVAGRDIRSTGPGGGWNAPVKLTNGTDVGAKLSKMAHFAGNNGEVHVVWTEWGIGERPDDDPNNSDNILWYVQGARVDAAVAVENVSDAPGAFELAQNYPNPFNPSTSISFTLPATGRTSLKVFDALGRQVATVFDEVLTAGSHKAAFNATNLPSGLYLYRLESGSSSASRSMMLVK